MLPKTDHQYGDIEAIDSQQLRLGIFLEQLENPILLKLLHFEAVYYHNQSQ